MDHAKKVALFSRSLVEVTLGEHIVIESLGGVLASGQFHLESNEGCADAVRAALLSASLAMHALAAVADQKEAAPADAD